MRNYCKALAGAAAIVAAVSTHAEAATSVGLELYLLADVSGSIDASEFNLQRTGYVNAFQSAAVQNAILNNPTGAIAATLIYWSGASQQAQVVPWTLIDSAASANAFAAAIAAAPRTYDGNTAPQSALSASVTNAAFDYRRNDFDSPRQVIDISGDGVSNQGLGDPLGRDAAVLAGVDVINGLVIGGDANVYTYYVNNVVAGGGVVFTADDFGDFGAAIQTKLTREIAPVPLPGAVWLFGSGIAGLLAARRRLADRRSAA